MPQRENPGTPPAVRAASPADYIHLGLWLGVVVLVILSLFFGWYAASPVLVLIALLGLPRLFHLGGLPWRDSTWNKKRR